MATIPSNIKVTREWWEERLLPSLRLRENGYDPYEYDALLAWNICAQARRSMLSLGEGSVCITDLLCLQELPANMPESIAGDLVIQRCGITNLKNSPRIVMGLAMGMVTVEYCPLVSLEGNLQICNRLFIRTTENRIDLGNAPECEALSVLTTHFNDNMKYNLHGMRADIRYVSGPQNRSSLTNLYAEHRLKALYTRTATEGIDPELGFSELLDVL